MKSLRLEGIFGSHPNNENIQSKNSRIFCHNSMDNKHQKTINGEDTSEFVVILIMYNVVFFTNKLAFFPTLTPMLLLRNE